MQKKLSAVIWNITLIYQNNEQKSLSKYKKLSLKRKPQSITG